MSAKDNFELLGMTAKDHRLLHFGASDHLFKASLCALAIDHIHATLLLQQYSEQHVEFGRSRQYAFVAELIDAVKEDSMEKFDLSVRNYGLYSTSHPWMFKVLQRIRESLPSVCGWSELEGSVPIENQNSPSKSNQFLTNMINRGTSLKAFYLQHTKHSATKTNSANSTSSSGNKNLSHSVKLSDLKVGRSFSNSSSNFVGGASSNSYDDYYDDELNPFSDNYRDASDEELDLR